MQDNGPEIRKDAEEIIEKINSADLSDDECRKIFEALKNQPEVIGGVVYTVTDAQDYVASAVVNLMLPDVEKGESAMYDLAMRETMPEAVSLKKEKKEKEEAKTQFPQTFEF